MSVPGPVLGPCQAWATGEDVAACCSDPGSEGAAAFDDVAVEASMLVYELGGRLYSGLCETTVRPCREACSCWSGSRSSGLAWFWSLGGPSAGGAWSNECGGSCGCGAESTIKLAGYPVREISEVKIDGAVLDPAGYRLDGWRKLVRLSDPGPPVVNNRWPRCQNMALDDDQPGTFSISYRFGVDPPELGRAAAAALACELWKACNGQACSLPTKATKIVRQGITVERVIPIAEMLRKGSSGVPQLDAFIAAYNPKGLRRRPAIWSPDVQQYPRRMT